MGRQSGSVRAAPDLAAPLYTILSLGLSLALSVVVACTAGGGGGAAGDSAEGSQDVGGTSKDGTVGWIEDIYVFLGDAAGLDGAADVAPGLPDAGSDGGHQDTAIYDGTVADVPTVDARDSVADVAGIPDVAIADAGFPPDNPEHADGGKGDAIVDAGGVEDVPLPVDTVPSWDTQDGSPPDASDDSEQTQDGGVDTGPDPDAGELDTGPPLEVCGNGFDDDGDGLPDCYDPECEGVPPCVEACADGKDNDIDGFTDCADPDCALVPVCIEVCTDGVDNDADGKVDCDDEDCAGEASCIPIGPTCDDMYVCLIESGCKCTIGVNCPADNSTCQSACYSDKVNCYPSCLKILPPEKKTAWTQWLDCLGASCGDYEGQAFVDCYSTVCLKQYTDCFYAGASLCDEVYFGCVTKCAPSDGECVATCLDGASPTGAYDLLTWDDCRFGLCDTNGDGSAESVECILTSTLVACAAVAGTCKPPLGDGQSCAEVTGCVLGCGSFGLQGCMESCTANVAQAEADALMDLWSCAITTCGATKDALTPACVEASMGGACKNEAAACGL